MNTSRSTSRTRKTEVLAAGGLLMALAAAGAAGASTSLNMPPECVVAENSVDDLLPAAWRGSPKLMPAELVKTPVTWL